MLTQLRRKREEGGYTLIELLIVIIILGILAAVVVLSINAIRDRGTESACRTEAEQVRVALAGYYSDNGSVYPASLINDELRRFLDSDPSQNWVLATGLANTTYSMTPTATGECADSLPTGITALTPTTGI